MFRYIPTLFKRRLVAKTALTTAISYRLSTTSSSSSAAAAANFNVKEVSKAQAVDEGLVNKLNPRTSIWLELDVAYRKRAQDFIKNVSASEDFAALYNSFFTSSATVSGTSPTKIENVLKTSDVKTLISNYCKIIAPSRVLKRKYDVLRLEEAAASDIIKRGLTAFTQDEINETQKKLEKIHQEIDKVRKEIDEIGKKYFTTDLFNEIINVLRIVAEESKNPSVVIVARKMFDDMNLLRVPFDEKTKMLLRNVVFGDGPLEDSSLLFTLVGFPETGEIDLSNKPLEAIAEDGLKIIAKRHQTPLSVQGVKKQLPDTHPMLQRSPD